MHRGVIVGIASLILFLAAALSLSGLTQDSLWDDEAWSVWAAGAPTLGESLARVKADVHPPLYFFLLHGWLRLAGDSVLALRLPSLFMGLLALAATYAVGARLFDRQTGLLALALLAGMGFLIYYTREARMYSLLLALGALTIYAGLRWQAQPTLRRALPYAALMAALLYTHYAGALLIGAQVLWLLWLALRGRLGAVGWRNGFIPFALALIAYEFWVPTLLDQLRANPGGPLALPLPTDWGTVAALLLILTGGGGLLYALPFILGSALPRARHHADGLVLLILWLLVTPMVLLLVNALARPLYQVRYVIAILPAFALLMAYGLRWVGDFTTQAPRQGAAWRVALQVGLLLALIVPQVGNDAAIWPGKPAWEPTIRAMIAARDPLEPTLTDLAPYSPAAYYDRHLGLRQGVSLDLSWWLHPFDELLRLVTTFDREDAVWVALPVNTAKSWHLVGLIAAERGATYRAALQNMIFYRFQRGAGAALQFRFGQVARYAGGAGAAERLIGERGEALCPPIQLEVLPDPPCGDTGATCPPDLASWSVGLHIVDITGNRSIAQWDGGLEAFLREGAPCLLIPPEAPAGHYHLELSLYNWMSGARLLVIEDGGGEPVGWGDVLRLAAVDVIE
jgi:hypothetical protein